MFIGSAGTSHGSTSRNNPSRFAITETDATNGLKLTEKFSTIKKKDNSKTGTFLVEQLIALLLAALPIKMRFAQGTACAEPAVCFGEWDQVGEKWKCWQAGVWGQKSSIREDLLC